MRRYSYSRHDECIEEEDDGDYVKFSDYKAEMQELIDTYDKLIAQKDKEIRRLSEDLSVSATMLARQCDLARDAERETLELKRGGRK